MKNFDVDNLKRIYEGHLSFKKNNKTIIFERMGLNEIDFDNHFSDVSVNCLNPTFIVKWLNDELARLNTNKYGKAADKKMRKDRGDAEDTIVTRGNIEQLIGKNGTVTMENIDMFIKNLTTEPDNIFESNPKMEKGDAGRPQVTVNTGIPAIVAIIYDEDKKQFISVPTCPSAGACKVGCYARKAFYGMDDSKTMKLTQRLNMLMNHPDRYQEKIFNELIPIAEKVKRSSIGMKPITLVIRWNDAGDFFGKKYFDIAVNTTKELLNKGYNVKSYAYTKRSEYVIELDQNNDFVVNFSTDAHHDDQEKIKAYDKDKKVKMGHRVPKSLFRNKGIFVEKRSSFEKNYENKLPIWYDKDSPNKLKDIIYNEFGEQFDIDRDSLRFTWELPNNVNKNNWRKYNLIVMPTGDSDIGAQRDDVKITFNLEH